MMNAGLKKIKILLIILYSLAGLGLADLFLFAVTGGEFRLIHTILAIFFS